MSADRITRRDFITAASTATTLLAVAPGLAQTATPAGTPSGANERIGIGLVGVGGRMSSHIAAITALAKSHNVEITAVCDVWRVNREAAAARIRKASGKTPSTSSRYQEMLALKEVDAVVVATPDFAHMPVTLAALRAGKDVYVEKPMSLSIEEANEALDIAREKQRIVQVGTQKRAEGKYHAARKSLADGALGKVSRISISAGFNQPRWMRASVEDCKEADVDWEAYLMGNPKRPFDAKLLRCWQCYKLCTNGLAGLWMAHYSDLVNLVTGAQFPTSAVSHGGIYVWKDGREHTDTFRTVLEYPEGFLFDWGMSLGTETGVDFNIYGTAGAMDVEKLTLDLQAADPKKPREQRKLKSEPNADYMANWLECLRSRQRPIGDIEYGHQHAVATVMAATALTTGRRQAYDLKKRQLHAG